MHLGFFSGNEIFWKTRWENSIAIRRDSLPDARQLQGDARKRARSIRRPRDLDGHVAGPAVQPAGRWRPARERTERHHLHGESGTTAITVPAAEGKLRFWRNTDVAALTASGVATLAAGTLGYEWDEDLDNGFPPAGLMRLSDTTVPSVQDASGLRVHLRQRNSESRAHALPPLERRAGVRCRHGAVGVGARQRSRPRLRRAQPGDAAGDDEPARRHGCAAVDAAGRTRRERRVRQTRPADVDRSRHRAAAPLFRPNSTVTITGTAADTGGGSSAASRSRLTAEPRGIVRRAARTGPTAGQPDPARTVTVMSRAVDDSGNLERPTARDQRDRGHRRRELPVLDLVADAVAWHSRRPTTASAVELGTQFRSDVNGFVTGDPVLQGHAELGPHVGNLWTRNRHAPRHGDPFSGESASGWQKVDVRHAGRDHREHDLRRVVSHGVRLLRRRRRLLRDRGVDNGAAARAARRAVDGPNGVYVYGASALPDQTLSSDQLLGGRRLRDRRSAPDTTPPQVSGVTPADGATGTSPSRTGHRHLQREHRRLRQ